MKKRICSAIAKEPLSEKEPLFSCASFSQHKMTSPSQGKQTFLVLFKFLSLPCHISVTNSITFTQKEHGLLIQDAQRYKISTPILFKRREQTLELQYSRNVVLSLNSVCHMQQGMAYQKKIIKWALDNHGSSSEYSDICLSCTDTQAQFNNLKEITVLKREVDNFLKYREKRKEIGKISRKLKKPCLSVWQNLCDWSLLLIFLKVCTAQGFLVHLLLLELAHITCLKQLLESKPNL